MNRYGMRATCGTILALDCGSTNFKAALFDRRLRRLAETVEPVRYSARGPLCVEFEAPAAWRTVARLIERALARAGMSRGAVSAVAVASQANTFCALEAAGRPLMPFRSWRDRRAAREAARLNRRLGADLPPNAGCSDLFAGHQAAMLLWMRRHAPDAFRRAAIFVNLPAYLLGRLGFPHAVDANLAAMSGLYSLRLGTWWPDCLSLCGVTPDRLPRLVPLGGRLVPEAPNPILPNLEEAVLAGNDQTAGAYANGCGPGRLVVTLGTALVAYRYAGRRARPLGRESSWGPYPGGGCYQLAERPHGCAALDWARARLAPGRDIRAFFEMAQRAGRRRTRAPGAPAARFYPGAIQTPRAWSGAADPAARALAVLEGIGFTLHDMLQTDLRVRKNNVAIAAIGGGSASAFWLQVLADILDRPVARGRGDALLGAARQAQPGIAPPRPGATFRPRDPGVYRALMKRWRRHAPASPGGSPT